MAKWLLIPVIKRGRSISIGDGEQGGRQERLLQVFLFRFGDLTGELVLGEQREKKKDYLQAAYLVFWQIGSIWLLNSSGCLLEQEAMIWQLIGGRLEDLWDSHEMGTGKCGWLLQVFC